MASGGMSWGVKSTFRAYVSSLADGYSEISSEIELPGKGAYRFPLADVLGNPINAICYRGSIAFGGHAGFLLVTFDDPSLEAAGDEWTFTVAAHGGRVAIADVDAVRTGPEPGSVVVDLRLNASGSDWFGGNYPAGTVLDPALVEAPTEALEALAARRA